MGELPNDTRHLVRVEAAAREKCEQPATTRGLVESIEGPPLFPGDSLDRFGVTEPIFLRYLIHGFVGNVPGYASLEELLMHTPS